MVRDFGAEGVEHLPPAIGLAGAPQAAGFMEALSLSRGERRRWNLRDRHLVRGRADDEEPRLAQALDRNRLGWGSLRPYLRGRRREESQRGEQAAPHRRLPLSFLR